MGEDFSIAATKISGKHAKKLKLKQKCISDALLLKALLDKNRLFDPTLLWLIYIHFAIVE